MKMQDSSILYKLIVMYMLKIADYPLTGSNISDYVLVKGYTDFLNLQITITDLENDKLIVGEKKHNRTFYTLTEEGITTIDSLEDKLASGLKADIYNHLATNDKDIKNEHSIQKKITETENGEYTAELTAFDKTGELMNIRLTFPTQSLASGACDRFESVSSDIYKYIIGKLMT